MSIFLEESDIAKLTGIKKGRNGESRERLQCQQLRLMGIAFWINARGAPIVSQAAVDGIHQDQPKRTWQPAVLRAVP